MNKPKIIKVEADIIDTNQALLDALLSHNVSHVEAVLERVDYSQWKGEIRIIKDYKIE